MSVIRLYFDADSMERAVVSGLRARGIDATSAREVGMTDGTDEEQLEFARSEGRSLFSFTGTFLNRRQLREQRIPGLRSLCFLLFKKIATIIAIHLHAANLTVFENG